MTTSRPDAPPVPEQPTTWYAVRCVLRVDDPQGGNENLYEERITLWAAGTFDAATSLAESEAVEYANATDGEYLGFAQAYQLGEPPGHGAEVFSLMRDSDLDPSDYLDRFFNAGSERQH